MKIKSSLLAFVVPISLLVSCGGSAPQSKYTQEDIALDKTTIALEKGGYDSLKIANEELAKEENLKWESSNVAVATIDADTGVVYAVDSGSATITVSFESLSSTCTVTVKDPHYAPIIEFDVSKVELKVNETFTLDAFVYFNEIDVTSASTFSFKAEDENVVELTPNANTVTIKGKKDGETTITATAIYNEKTTAEAIDVTVNPEGSDISIMSNSEDVTPYGNGFTASIYVGNIPGFDGTVEPNFSVYKNGELVIGPTLTYENVNPDVCRYIYGDNVIQAVSNGTGQINVSFEGNKFPIYVNVGVPNVTIENDSYMLELARANGTIELGDEIKDYLANNQVTSVTYDGIDIFTSYDVASKTITYNSTDALKQVANYSESINDYSKEMIIRTDAAVFTCTKVCCLAMLIKDVNDLKTISGATSTNPKYGLYVLNNDINCGYSMASPLYCNGTWGDTGLKGILDGNNHTISNLYVRGQGFFGNIGSGAVIKNVNFVDCGMADHVNGLGATYSPFFARHCYPCTIQNVNITFADIFGNKQKEKDIDSSHHALPDHRIQNEEGLLFSIMNGGIYTFKDVTIDATADAVCDDNIVGSKGNVHTAFAAMCSISDKSVFSNVLIKVKYYSQFAFRDQIDNYASMYKDNVEVKAPTGVTIQGTLEKVFTEGE